MLSDIVESRVTVVVERKTVDVDAATVTVVVSEGDALEAEVDELVEVVVPGALERVNWFD